MRSLITLCSLSILCACQPAVPEIFVETSDIERFWIAYDQITATADTAEKRRLLRELYLDPATPGLEKLREVRRYAEDEYLDIIASYPRFWASIRENMLRAPEFGDKVAAGVVAMKKWYNCPKPAHFYFGVGAFRTSGTAVDSFVLIGSEFAFADSTAVTAEFSERVRESRATYFATNPIDNLYGTFVHEYVHTQQEPIPTGLLYQCLYEGVAEFFSCLATGETPDPAVRFGQALPDSVRAVFEREMFDNNNRSKWLWGDAPNVFDQRDLGYYVGYAMSERYYISAPDKRAAIRELIELDYTDTTAVRRIIDVSEFLSAPVADLARVFQADQPYVTQLVREGNTFIATFSEPMDIRYRNFQYGPGGPPTVMRADSIIGFAADSLSFSFATTSLPATSVRELVLGPGFRDASGVGMRPYLIRVEGEER